MNVSEVTRAGLLAALDREEPVSDWEKAFHGARVAVVKAMSEKSISLKGEEVVNSTCLSNLSTIAARRRTGTGGTRSLKALAKYVTTNHGRFGEEIGELGKGQRVTQRGLRLYGITKNYNVEDSRAAHKHTERYFSSQMYHNRKEKYKILQGLDNLSEARTKAVTDERKALLGAKLATIKAMSAESFSDKGISILSAKSLRDIALVAAKRRTGSGGTRSLKALADYINANGKDRFTELASIDERQKVTQRGLRLFALQVGYNEEKARRLHSQTQLLFSSRMQDPENMELRFNFGNAIKLEASGMLENINNGRMAFEGNKSPYGKELVTSSESYSLNGDKMFPEVIIPKVSIYTEIEKNLNLISKILNRGLGKAVGVPMEDNIDFGRSVIKLNGDYIDQPIERRVSNQDWRSSAEHAYACLDGAVEDIENENDRNTAKKTLSYLFNQRILAEMQIVVPHISDKHCPFLAYGEGFEVNYKPVKGDSETLDYIDIDIVSMRGKGGDNKRLAENNSGYYSYTGFSILPLDLDFNTAEGGNNDSLDYICGFGARMRYILPSEKKPIGEVQTLGCKSYLKVGNRNDFQNEETIDRLREMLLSS